MDKILKALGFFLDKLTFKKVVASALLIFFGLSGYIGYLYSNRISENLTSYSLKSVPFEKLNPKAIALTEDFMKKHKDDVMYLTILRFDFSINTRIPIYRYFNNHLIREIVMGRLNGGDGRLPIFIDGDTSNNNQVIALMRGEIICSPFKDGGLARVWPDLVPKFTTSCRVPIPPGYGATLRGYIVVHSNVNLSDYQLEVLKLDLLELASKVHDATK